jgi:hypothetical protein
VERESSLNGRLFKGTGQIGVILNAKATIMRARRRLTSFRSRIYVEHDFIPVDGADAFQWRVIGSIGDRVALAEAGDFPPRAHQRDLIF